MVLQTCGNLFHQAQSGFVKKRRKRKKRKKKVCLLHYEILIFVGVLWLRTGLYVNILINCKDFLRLRSEPLEVTLKFMCPFGEIFYLAHSLLTPLQSLSSFWRPNITVKANPPLTPYSPFSFHSLTVMRCQGATLKYLLEASFLPWSSKILTLTQTTTPPQ